MNQKVINDQVTIPEHVGLILDGNRRWAKKAKLSSLEGHRRGLDNLKNISQHAFKRGVKIITVFAFSTENWKRSSQEVTYLLRLLKIFIKKEVKDLIKEGIKIKFLGRLQDFDKSLFGEMKKTEEITKNGTTGQLNICLSYGGRDEILRAIRKIVSLYRLQDNLKISGINEEVVNKYLDTISLKDPDLIIRTSGEQRLSGFLTWQSVYSELYFSSKFWPAFTAKDFDAALKEYSCRQRRFGCG